MFLFENSVDLWFPKLCLQMSNGINPTRPSVSPSLYESLKDFQEEIKLGNTIMRKHSPVPKTGGVNVYVLSSHMTANSSETFFENSKGNQVESQKIVQLTSSLS